MGNRSTVAYEWHIPDRVYIIGMEGLVTVNLMDTALRHVLGVLNDPKRESKLHLIYDIEHVRLESAVPLSYILSVTAELYKHHKTASLVAAIGLNRLHGFIANETSKAYSRENQQGHAVATRNEALRFVHTIDPFLPPRNI